MELNWIATIGIYIGNWPIDINGRYYLRRWLGCFSRPEISSMGKFKIKYINYLLHTNHTSNN